MKEKPLKLTMELIPEQCQQAPNSNLRKQMHRRQWDRIRRTVFTKAGYVCDICGAEGRLNCHEVWTYDDGKDCFLQKLAGLIALCNLCHHVKHFDLAENLAAQGRLDLDVVVEHFKKVNNVGQEEFESHRLEAFRIWQERSWKYFLTDLGEFEAEFGITAILKRMDTADGVE